MCNSRSELETCIFLDLYIVYLNRHIVSAKANPNYLIILLS